MAYVGRFATTRAKLAVYLRRKISEKGWEAPRPPETLDDVLAAGLPLPTMEAAETALIREALRRFDGNRRQTADALGISERTLYRKIRDPLPSEQDAL